MVDHAWNKMNRTRLVDYVKRLSDEYEWVSWSCSSEDVDEYRKAYGTAMKLAPNDYALLGCLRPDCYRERER